MSLVRVVEDKMMVRQDPRTWTSGRYSAYDMRRYRKPTTVHIFEQGETLLQNLENRRQRPSARYKALVLAQHPELEGRIRWSQKAGCSCGCSPGFIVDDIIRVNGSPADIYITITSDPLPKKQEVDMSYVEMALA